MLHLKIHKSNICKAAVDAVTDLLKGKVIAYPTETFYALGVKFDMPDAQRKLYELKKRPQEKAMPVIIGDISLLSALVSKEWLANIPSSAKALMDRFWPGPLTLLLPAKEGLPEYLTANTGMIGVRIPGESFALQLAKKSGFPITATSANISGLPPAKDADEVRRYFDGGIDLLIDGGTAPGGLPSTIVDASGRKMAIIREGTINRQMLEYLV